MALNEYTTIDDYMSWLKQNQEYINRVNNYINSLQNLDVHPLRKELISKKNSDLSDQDRLIIDQNPELWRYRAQFNNANKIKSELEKRNKQIKKDIEGINMQEIESIAWIDMGEWDRLDSWEINKRRDLESQFLEENPWYNPFVPNADPIALDKYQEWLSNKWLENTSSWTATEIDPVTGLPTMSTQWGSTVPVPSTTDQWQATWWNWKDTYNAAVWTAGKIIPEIHKSADEQLTWAAMAANKEAWYTKWLSTRTWSSFGEAKLADDRANAVYREQAANIKWQRDAQLASAYWGIAWVQEWMAKAQAEMESINQQNTRSSSWQPSYQDILAALRWKDDEVDIETDALSDEEQAAIGSWSKL